MAGRTGRDLGVSLVTVVVAAAIGAAAAALGVIEGAWWVGAVLFAGMTAIGEAIGRAVAGTFRRDDEPPRPARCGGDRPPTRAGALDLRPGGTRACPSAPHIPAAQRWPPPVKVWQRLVGTRAEPRRVANPGIVSLGLVCAVLCLCLALSALTDGREVQGLVGLGLAVAFSGWAATIRRTR